MVATYWRSSFVLSFVSGPAEVKRKAAVPLMEVKLMGVQE